jgi:Ca-activated chloride channel family protein
MNFNHINYLPGLILLVLIFMAIIVLMEKRFFKFVKTYWFYNRSIFSYISTFLFLLGMSGLVFSLLDPRGPEEKIKMQIPKDRTIILIDTSASMLAEDVKPSRLQKAVLIAKHFARKAAGHQISIVAFAEVQKKIVPFTTDVDLIDARLDSLKNLRNQYGSSALTLAIQESLQYFKEIEGEARGNILVLTDGEETSEGINLKVPKDVHVALVGVGSTQGGRIPLDDGRGFRFGYKKDRGQDIITKLNESFFKTAVADIPSGKYWLANSYTLPSEEILEFFQKEKMKGNEDQDMVIKPVLMEWIVVPSVILLFLSYLFKSIRVFSLGMLLIIMPLQAQENEPKELSPEMVQRLSELQRGELSKLEKIKLADDLQKAGSKDEALSLYEENLPAKIDKSIPGEAYLNYGTALLQKGDVQKGLTVYEKLSESLKSSPEDNKIKDIMDRNVLSFFQQQEQKKKEEEKKDKEKKENKDNKENKDDKDGQSGSGQKKDQKDSSGKQDKKDPKEGSEDQKKEDQKKSDEKKDEEKKDEPKDEDKKESDADKGEQEKPMPPKKVPAKLKQLMSDDRQLQMKMIENGTRDLNKRKSRKSKDW